MKFNHDISNEPVSFTVEETAGDFQGQHVLGKLKGTFFVPDGVSRNKRFYPKELWEKVCSDPSIVKKLQEKRMLGTIGHTQEINDSSILDGKISHVVTNLQIQNGNGLGEALILDTPAGKVLNSLLRAGCKLFVSSRADGSFKGEENGVPRVDPDTYQLVGFDVVCDPGFMQANPELVESINRILGEVSSKPQNIEGDGNMDLLEKLAKENGGLKIDIEKIGTELDTVKGQNLILAKETNDLKAKLDKQQRAEALVEKYRALGSPEEIERVLDISENRLNQLKELGTVAEIRKALELSEKALGEYAKIGTHREINEALDKAIAVVESYNELGSPAEIREAFDRMESRVETLRKDRSEKRIAEMAKELKVSEDKIRKVYGKLPENEIKALFSNVTETAQASSKISEIYRKKEGTKSPAESAPKSEAPWKKPLGSRLLEMYSPTDDDWKREPNPDPRTIFIKK